MCAKIVQDGGCFMCALYYVYLVNAVIYYREFAGEKMSRKDILLKKNMQENFQAN